MLTPLSWIYGGAALLRRRWHAGRARRLDRPVISIGNITCGGTGKTPAVEMVARDLLRLGRRPAVLSRGYRGEGGWNDEMRVLAANLPEVPLYASADRHRIGVEAIARGADVLVLDDGFQHVKLARDLDFVLVDAMSPFGGGRVLPAGLLREPLGTLAGADLIGITRSNRVSSRMLATLSAYLRNRFPGTPQALIEARPLEWIALEGGREPPPALEGVRALAFCGIGNPESFRRDALALGIDVAELVPFRDHHRYTPLDIERLERRAEEIGARTVIMTQKDAVKIPANGAAARWKYLRIESRIVRGEDAYSAALERAIRGGAR